MKIINLSDYDKPIKEAIEQLRGAKKRVTINAIHELTDIPYYEVCQHHLAAPYYRKNQKIHDNAAKKSLNDHIEYILKNYFFKQEDLSEVENDMRFSFPFVFLTQTFHQAINILISSKRLKECHADFLIQTELQVAPTQADRQPAQVEEPPAAPATYMILSDRSILWAGDTEPSEGQIHTALLASPVREVQLFKSYASVEATVKTTFH